KTEPRGAERAGHATRGLELRYAALLRSYVLMGSGTMGAEIADIVNALVEARIAPPDALQLHVACVETLVRGLGNRSARHVVARGDLLAVELMTRLAQRGAAGNSGLVTTNSIRNVAGAAGIDLTAEPPRA